MEGIGIWIFLLLFYLLQALTKRKQKQKRQQQSEAPRPKPRPARVPRPGEGTQTGEAPRKPKKPVSLEDLFNPDKLRDILGVPQPEPAEIPRPTPQPRQRPSKPVMREKWVERQQSKPSLKFEEDDKITSTVGSADITDVDESAARFKASRIGRSDITSDRFDQRDIAPGKKKPKVALEFFDEPEDIRNAVILKEILDRPRAFRRQIR